MKGCRPLNKREIQKILQCFTGKFATRDKAIFTLGQYTGERISAILQVKISDIMQNGKISDCITYRKATRKGKTESRTVALHKKAKKSLQDWIKQLKEIKGSINQNDYVFVSRKGKNKPISRIQFFRILKNAVKKNKLTGKIATHSLRKTFANKIYKALGNDIYKLQRALGHKNINTTTHYISFREFDIQKAIMQM